jgi:hypothetical protein
MGTQSKRFGRLKVVSCEKLDMEVIAVDWGKGFASYRSSRAELQDQK